MGNILLLFISLTTGILFRKFDVLPANANTVLNKLLIYFFIPGLTLLYIPETNFNPQFLLPIISSWLVYLFSFLFFYAVSNWQGFDRKTMAALIMTGGIGSTSFVGFPIFELFYGKEGLEIGIIMSIAGTIVVCMTLGIATGSWLATSNPSVKKLIKNIVRFPPFIAFLIAIALNVMAYQHHPLTKEILQKISSPYSIIALMTIGLQIDFSLPKGQRKPLALGLLYKLILAPFIIYFLMTNFTNASKIIIEITVLGAAIGSMNLIAIIASQMNLNPPLASKMVAIGIPISIFTLLLIQLFFQQFG